MVCTGGGLAQITGHRTVGYELGGVPGQWIVGAFNGVGASGWKVLLNNANNCCWKAR